MQNNQYLIKNIAKDMFLLNSEHLQRLESFGRKVCLNTIKDKRRYIELIIKTFGEKDIKQLQVREIESFLLNDHIHSGSWKNNYLETFSTIYEETTWKCHEQIRKPQFIKFKRNSKNSDILNNYELSVFYDEKLWESKRDYLIFLLIGHCGLRLGEARGIRLNQIDFNKKFLLVNGFCKHNGQRVNHNKGGNEKNRKYRIVPLSEEILNKVFNFIKYDCKEKNEMDFLFTSVYTGKPLSQEYLRKTFARQLKKAGINTVDRKLTPHSLRFTFVTKMRKTLPGEVVQKIVGHSSLAMTDYYTKFALEDLLDGIKESFPIIDKLYE